jgi:DNA-binding GntR family transcriptional regulator
MQFEANFKNMVEHSVQILPQRKSLSDEVFEVLLNRIVVGNYSPGRWLRQNDIAQELSVSHTPVREAFDRLVTEGLAERVPYHGVRVPKMESEQIMENYQARIVMEISIVNLSAQFISDSSLQQVEIINDEIGKLKKLKDMPRHRQLNRSFHLLIAENCQNPQLIRLHQLAWNQFPDWMLYERIFHQQEMLNSSLEREYQDHQEIISALKSHQPQQAMRMAYQHMVNVGDELVSLLSLPEDAVRSKQQAASAMIRP